MSNAYSMVDLLEFLDHAGERGLMPAATAQALGVAARNVLGILSDQERSDLSQLEIDSVIKRFNNKRAKDFNPSSLKEYARRIHKAIDLFLKWRQDPANFTVKTRASTSGRKRDIKDQEADEVLDVDQPGFESSGRARPGTYRSAVPVRPGVVITLVNVPYDLTPAEADRIANFVKMLAINSQPEMSQA